MRRTRFVAIMQHVSVASPQRTRPYHDCGQDATADGQAGDRVARPTHHHRTVSVASITTNPVAPPRDANVGTTR